MQQAGVAQKVNYAVNSTVKEVTSEAPLPPEDAKALAKIIQEAGKLGIALRMKTFDFIYGGQFKIELEEQQVAGVSYGNSATHRTEVAKKVSQIVQRNSRWIAGSTTNLIFKTPILDATIKVSDTKPSGDFIKEMKA